VVGRAVAGVLEQTPEQVGHVLTDAALAVRSLVAASDHGSPGSVKLLRLDHLGIVPGNCRPGLLTAAAAGLVLAQHPSIREQPADRAGPPLAAAVGLARRRLPGRGPVLVLHQDTITERRHALRRELLDNGVGAEARPGHVEHSLDDDDRLGEKYQK